MSDWPSVRLYVILQSEERSNELSEKLKPRLRTRTFKTAFRQYPIQGSLQILAGDYSMKC